MDKRKVELTRKTRETAIKVELLPESPGNIAIQTGHPFLDHLLQAAAFHGGFGLMIRARGDSEVDPHHTVEDIGIVLGECLKKLVAEHGPVKRFGHAVIPMDEALAEINVDVCGRPTLVLQAEFPQPRVGDFDLVLLRELLLGLANRAGISLHARARYGENSHHMAEALFKALGKAVGQAFAPESEVRSTKGTLQG